MTTIDAAFWKERILFRSGLLDTDQTLSGTNCKDLENIENWWSCHRVTWHDCQCRGNVSQENVHCVCEGRGEFTKVFELAFPRSCILPLLWLIKDERRIEPPRSGSLRLPFAISSHVLVTKNRTQEARLLTHYRPEMPFENRRIFLVLSQFKKYHPSGNVKFNNLSIF